MTNKSTSILQMIMMKDIIEKKIVKRQIIWNFVMISMILPIKVLKLIEIKINIKNKIKRDYYNIDDGDNDN